MTTGQFISDVLPLAIAGSCSPTTLAIGILILSSRNRPLAKAVVFTIGNLLVLAGVGLVTLFFAHATSTTSAVSASPNAVDATIDVFVGALLVVLTLKHLLGPKSPTADTSPSWLKGLDRLSFWRSFLIGVGIMAINVSTLVVFLPAVRYVGKYAGDLGNELALLAAVVLIVESWMLAVLAMSFLAPQKSGRALRKLNVWVGKHSRTICSVLFGIFGVYFLIKGLTELL
jgi:hypothetical protein